MDDEPEVAADADGPEVLVLGPVQLMEACASGGRVDLQVEGAGLDRFLLVTGQPSEAVGEGVRDQKFHVGTYGPAGRASCSGFISRQGPAVVAHL